VLTLQEEMQNIEHPVAVRFLIADIAIMKQKYICT
jgi:hypothetical protein